VSRHCLGARVADLADGRLSPAETERALAHVAVCSPCRAALQAQRSVSGGLRAASEPAPASPPDDLMARLLRIPEQPVDPAAPVLPAIPLQGGAGARPVGPAGPRPRVVATSRRPSRRRKAVLGTAAGAVLVVAAALGGNAALSGQVTTPSPAIAPVVDTLTVEHAASTDGMPLSGPRYETVAYSGVPDDASPGPSAP
jgi:predicted anti-sigma-YlaC factor YlaD